MKILAKLVVHADVKLVSIETARAGAGVIVVDAPAANIGQGHQLHQVDGWSREPGCRNDVSCKWGATCCTGRIALRIVDLVGGTTAQGWVEIVAEIAIPARNAGVM